MQSYINGTRTRSSCKKISPTQYGKRKCYSNQCVLFHMCLIYDGISLSIFGSREAGFFCKTAILA